MRVLVIIAVVVTLQGCGGSSAEPVSREIRVALSRDAITWLPVHLAEHLGYDRQEGLLFAVSDVAGLSKGAEALIGGAWRLPVAARRWRCN